MEELINKELIYTIDKARSEEDNALAIKIQLAERTGFTLNVIKNQPLLTKERLKRLETPKDAALIPFLIKEENAYVKKTTGRSLDEHAPFNLVHVSYNMVANALKLFAMCGKLYFNDKQLVIDLFGKTEFYYCVDATSGDTTSGKPRVQGHIKTTTQDFNLDTCDFIGKGPPHYFIKGINLKYIGTEISWKDLKATFEGSPPHMQDIIDEAAEDEEAPRLIATASSTLTAAAPAVSAPLSPDPLPILVLKDRLGAFADLSMYYGDHSLEVDYNDSKSVVDKAGNFFCKRQPAVERGWEKDLLETDFIKKNVGTSQYYCPLDKVAKSIAFLLEIGWQVRDARGNTVLLHHHNTLIAEAKLNDIVIRGKLHYDKFEADVSQIVGAFNRRERFAEIAPGHVALLPQNLEQIGLSTLAEEGEIVGETIRLKKNNLGALSGLLDTHPQLGLDAALTELKDKLIHFQGIDKVSPGEIFCGTLRPYQEEGLSWLSFLYHFNFHGMLADDMGLGKTVQVLAFLSTISLSSPTLIIMPTSLLFNWKKEIERFLPGVACVVHHGPKRQQTPQELASAQIIVTSYTTARLDYALLSQLTFSCLILDEAQAIKNAGTQVFQTVSRLSSHFRLSITGTPIENHLMELWSHFRFLLPDLFGDEASFAAEIQAGASDPRFIKRIKKKIRPFLLRRCKEEVAKDLPEKIEQTVWIEMEETQRAVYEEFLSGVRRNLISKVNADGISKHRMEILEAIMRLRQICCHPLLVSSTSSEGMRESAESAKLEALMEDLQTAVAEKRKVLVYSQFTSMLSLIGKRLHTLGWEYAYLDGSTQNREKVVTRFQEDPDLQIFLISLKAGGVGLNLTAADYVLLYDPWWNAAAENQAIDRAHRIGRKDTVIAKRYIMTESIEEKMMKLKAAKSSLAAEILDDEGKASSALSADDLLFLLS